MDYILMIMPVDALTDGRHGKDVQSRVKEPTPLLTFNRFSMSSYRLSSVLGCSFAVGIMSVHVRKLCGVVTWQPRKLPK